MKLNIRVLHNFAEFFFKFVITNHVSILMYFQDEMIHLFFHKKELFAKVLRFEVKKLNNKLN